MIRLAATETANISYEPTKLLRLESGWDTFIRFDVTPVLKAKLRFWVVKGGSIEIFKISPTYLNSNVYWTEAGLTPENTPYMYDPITAETLTDTWFEVEVTAPYSFALVGDGVYLKDPELVLIFDEPVPNPEPENMWADLKALPTTGAAWENLYTAAKVPVKPNLSDPNNKDDTTLLAKAFVYAKTGDYLTEIETALKEVIGTEAGSGILAVCRNLQGYVIAANIIKYDDPVFKQWLANIRTVVFSGAGPSLSIVQCHEIRPNNFGTHAGATRMAIDIYLGDDEDLTKAVTVFKGWLGDRSAYTGFKYGDLSWQADPNAPVGINPKEAIKEGHSIDGVLPDDQRRGGVFTWPAPKEGYVFEALQGVLAQGVLLSRKGYPVWEWSDKAILRAFKWLYEVANYPAEGDDAWQPWIVNYFYDTNFPTKTPTTPGKNVGWADWTHTRI